MNFKITKIEGVFIPELVKLADLSLGIEYVNEEYFSLVLKSNDYDGWIVLDDNNKLIAFLTSYVTSVNEIVKIVNDESLRIKLGDKIICIDKLVVNANYRKMGIGKKLLDVFFQGHLDNYEVIMYAWNQKGVINMERLANYYRFKKLNEYHEIWALECEENRFTCPVKQKNERCCCSAVLYYLKQTI